MKMLAGHFVLKLIFLILSITFITSIFKNISYPLLWADESITVMGTERVSKFGYPKINDGKNVVYDLRHSNKKLGANESLDAYIGGAGWLQYYYGVIGYKIAEKFDDFYTKTGILRSLFAIAGLLGLFLLMQWASSFYSDEKEKFIFKIFFILLTLFSISLTLLIREVRYYALVFLVFYSLLVLYLNLRLKNQTNNNYFIFSYICLHLISILTFSPLYFIILASFGIMESGFFISNYKKEGLRKAYEIGKPILIATIISGILSVPIFIFFKTFEINKIMSEFNGYSSEMYWNNFKTALTYFTKFEHLNVVLLVKISTIIFINNVIKTNQKLFQISLFLAIVTVVYILAISRIHGFLYTRYIIFLQPLMSIIIFIDGYLLYKVLVNKGKNVLAVMTVSVICIMIFYKMYENRSLIQGHFYEMTHQYKGPLDETINYIKDNFEDPSKLVIATNYEETSFMYYLKSKVIIGYVENNLAEDLKFKPDIIAYRPNWGDPSGVFANYIKDNEYFVKRFTLRNLPVNTISEFNYLPNYTHKFQSEIAENYKESVQLWILKKYYNEIE